MAQEKGDTTEKEKEQTARLGNELYLRERGRPPTGGRQLLIGAKITTLLQLNQKRLGRKKEQLPQAPGRSNSSWGGGGEGKKMRKKPGL